MLTRRQKEVYEWIGRYIRNQGYAPSYDEIKAGLGLRSLNTVFHHLRQLEAKGCLRSPWANKKRAIELIEQPSFLQLLGEVQAGVPVESYEVPEQADLPSGIFDPELHFALRVKGDSMVGEGMLEGDIIVIRKSDAARNGQVVVALVDGEATVKKFCRKNDKIELVPANPSYKPVAVKEGQLKILGLVVALFRNY